MTLIDRLSLLIANIKAAIGGLDTRVSALEAGGGGLTVTVGTTPPTSPSVGDFWVDMN